MSAKAQGRIVRLRLSSMDCIGVAQVASTLQLHKGRYSLDQTTRIVLTALLEFARVQNVIPQSSGFEYSELMEQFERTSPMLQKERALQSERLNEQLVAEAAQDAPRGFAQLRPTPAQPRPPKVSPRYEELAFKMQQDPVNMSQAERDELTTLTQQFFPL